MTPIRLSICIATYNRADYIGETLDSIIPQITDEVEIVIADGASTDNTGEVVNKYVKACSRIRYTRLLSKGGVDADYCKAVELAQGEYCWLFTDDDLLRAGAINAVLDEIAKGYGLIIVNAQVKNRDFSKVLEDKRLQIDANEVYLGSDISRLLNQAVVYMSFIGCVVIKRNLWLQREKERYFGTEFIHLGVIFQTPLPAPVLIISEPYITIRLGNAQWTPRAFEIWLYKWPNLISSFDCVSKRDRQEYKKVQSWRLLTNIITFRAMGGYSLKEYRKWLASADSSLWWKFIVWLIAVAPAGSVNLFLLLYFKIMWWLVKIFDAITLTCFRKAFMLSYFKKIRKEAPKTIYYLERNEHYIVNIIRSRKRPLAIL